MLLKLPIKRDTIIDHGIKHLPFLSTRANNPALPYGLFDDQHRSAAEGAVVRRHLLRFTPLVKLWIRQNLTFLFGPLTGSLIAPTRETEDGSVPLGQLMGLRRPISCDEIVTTARALPVQCLCVAFDHSSSPFMIACGRISRRAPTRPIEEQTESSQSISTSISQPLV